MNMGHDLHSSSQTIKNFRHSISANYHGAQWTTLSPQHNPNKCSDPATTIIAHTRRRCLASFFSAETNGQSRSLFRAAVLLLFHLVDEVVVFGHDIVPVFHAVVEFLHEVIALRDEVGDGFVLFSDAGVGVLQF